MTRFVSGLALGVAGAISAAAPSLAMPITYTESVTASGSLGGTSFSSKLVTLMMANVNTSNVMNPGTDLFDIGGSVTVTVAGVGSGTFNDSIAVFSNFSPSLTSPLVGFADTTFPNPSPPPTTTVLDILTSTSSMFNNYDLKTSIGPISGTAGIPTTSESFSTTAGALILTPFTGTPPSATFSAVAAAPAPVIGRGLPVALAVGIVFLGAWLLQRPRKRHSPTA